MKSSVLSLALMAFALSSAAQESLLNRLNALKDATASTNAKIAAPSLGALGAATEEQTANALKEALAKGAESAVRQLGVPGGFLTNLNVKIPMPPGLQKVEKTLRTLKQEALADEFVTTMNRAAESAVPAAATVFTDSIKQMSIADARAILAGSNDAATQYFRRTSTNALQKQFLPIVKKATDAAGVTAAYKAMLAKVGPAASVAQGLGGSFGKSLGFDAASLDLDSYVTARAMDGLFKMVAEEEKRIRENPVARSTDLLKQVFGAVKKP